MAHNHDHLLRRTCDNIRQCLTFESAHDQETAALAFTLQTEVYKVPSPDSP